MNPSGVPVYAIGAGLLCAITVFQVLVGLGVRAPINSIVSLLIPFAGLVLGRAAARFALFIALTWLALVVVAEWLGWIPGMEGTRIPTVFPAFALYCTLCVCVYALTTRYTQVVARAVTDLIVESDARNLAELGKTEAEAVLKYKDEFLAMLSHEIRTPLSGVASGVQLMSHPYCTDAMRERALGAIRQAVDNTTDVLNNLLENSKIDAGQLKLHATAVDVPALLDKLQRVYRVQAEARQLQFAVDVTQLPGQPFWLDASRITQMLSNLVSNALKFTTGGEVRVVVAWLSDSAVLSGQGANVQTDVAQQSYLLFSVSDTGPGISEANQARLFQEYVQIRESGYSHLGTGLGLVVVRKLAHQMGGVAGVRSVEGAGSTFWFTVPTAPVRTAVV